MIFSFDTLFILFVVSWVALFHTVYCFNSSLNFFFFDFPLNLSMESSIVEP